MSHGINVYQSLFAALDLSKCQVVSYLQNQMLMPNKKVENGTHLKIISGSCCTSETSSLMSFHFDSLLLSFKCNIFMAVTVCEVVVCFVGTAQSTNKKNQDGRHRSSAQNEANGSPDCFTLRHVDLFVCHCKG